MKATIYMVTITSYTAADNNIYSDVKTFADEQQAIDCYDRTCDQQRGECQWGEYADNEDHADDYQYPYTDNHLTEEREAGGYVLTYEASSEAYEGYRVQVKLEKQEVEIAYATDRRKYGMTLKEIRDEIAAFTGDNKSDAMAKARVFAHHISIANVCSIRLSFGKYSRTENGKTVYYGENRDTLHIEWTDLDGDSDTFSIIE
jgi:hypothetical protein